MGAGKGIKEAAHRFGHGALVVGCLPGVLEALSSIPSDTQAKCVGASLHSQSKGGRVRRT